MWTRITASLIANTSNARKLNSTSVVSFFVVCFFVVCVWCAAATCDNYGHMYVRTYFTSVSPSPCVGVGDNVAIYFRQ